MLFVDADGATHYSEIEGAYLTCREVTSKSGKNLGCVIGSRNIGVKTVTRNPLRKFLNFCMNTLVHFVLGSDIQDTQCGFKILSRDAAKRVFPTLHLERWAFDIELLQLCAAKGITVQEIPVRWEDVDGSHLNVVTASLQMARDMILIKCLYKFKLWGLDDYNW